MPAEGLHGGAPAPAEGHPHAGPREVFVRHIDTPERAPLGAGGEAWLALRGAVLSPLYWLAAVPLATPGLGFRARCAGLGLRALPRARAAAVARCAYNLLFYPMDSTRHFEFDFAWRRMAAGAAGARRYLDVSSPRVLPLAFVRSRPGLSATLLNPDPKDLAVTSALAQALGVERRCEFLGTPIADADLEQGRYDVVTSLSVVEHIADDTEAVARMWALLRPGGRLVLTLPCAARYEEQFIDRNYYGLLEADERGYVFWQRLYDERALAERILRVTGAPRVKAVYGEKVAGSFLANAAHKRASFAYPFWREPVMMGREFRPFAAIGDLPGEGVVGLEFVKP